MKSTCICCSVEYVAVKEEGGNSGETSETPKNRTSQRMGRGYKIEDSGTEEDIGDGQEDIEATADQEPRVTLADTEKENVAGSSGKACSSVPTEEEPPEKLQLLMQYMIDMDACQKEEETAKVGSCVEDMLTMDVDCDVHLDGPKMGEDTSLFVKAKVRNEKMEDETAASENLSEVESSQQDQEVEGAGCQSTERVHLGTEESPDETINLEDEGVPKEAAKKEPTFVEGGDQNKSSTEDEKGAKNGAEEKGQSCNSSTSGNAGKNLWVSELSAATRATDLKNLFSEYGKVVCAKVVTDAHNPGARCYGFITMSTLKEAAECISFLNHSELSGQIITVEMASNESGSKKHSVLKGGDMKKDCKSTFTRKTGNDRRHSREKSSASRKGDDRKDGQEDSRKTDDKRDRKRGKYGHRHRSSHSRESRRRSRDSDRRRSRDRVRRSESRRRSRSRDGRRDVVSFEKLIALRQRKRQWDHKRELWEIERQRERGAWEQESRREQESRDLLERERERLQLERMRLERERMEREALERERLLIEGERRREQERIYREKEELFREMCFDRTLKRPCNDVRYGQGWNNNQCWKMEGFPDHSQQGGMEVGIMGRDYWKGGDRGMHSQSGQDFMMQRRAGIPNQGNFIQGGYQHGPNPLDNRSGQMMPGINRSGGNPSGGYRCPY
ncbi:scaffold attachment factor B2-like isoform X2 [Callorhinchus milii]|uniref:scaffold attachment factor B2-like isoform X2 n=1 Tax=Callorhinchus milii TaxID=7868 RepID=UPI0004573FBB|nr:scaffold attachment factor B2-like isoform X2 [Callorhinchus milii]XP_007899220.1 scaffold attachment factor B2-like isoform X2 [Callorhinchus milii]|eukprot:gi/632966076/ref/XP_007899218.1/ PREDICTED: scaffold attachment factor B2-like isoform X3 [Callorhinchus milii]